MKIENFLDIINADFFTGVPDSQLKSLCNYLMNKYGIDKEHHIIAANEGNCVGIAAGYYLATEKIPVVYMQNSGEGNVVNPVTSLLSGEVYGIPMIFIIGWRGEPGIHDEPQHIFQGKITRTLLDILEIENYVIDKSTTPEEVYEVMQKYQNALRKGKSVAFIICKDALQYECNVEYRNENTMRREEIIQHIIKISENDPVISTTGKASRELFENRVLNGQSNKYDFLTVGSMGHSSSIALGVAVNKPDRKIWCIDGDGAAIMHMGAMAVIGNNKPDNMVHIIINNEAHETVGGMPTVSTTVDWKKMAKAVGYPYAVSVNNFEVLDYELKLAKERKGLCLIEVKSAIGARNNLGRPTISSIANKEHFMEYLKEI